MEHKLGLVLARGGGNAAYQVGVWKCLCEAGISNRFSVVSGTSAGALNAALFSVSSCGEAEMLWKGGLEEKILCHNSSAEESLCEAVSSFLGGDMGLLGGSVLSLASGGIWGRGGLLRLMRGIPLEKLHGRGSPAVYATCSAVYPPLGVRHFRLNGFDVRTMRKILLATSAIPLAFRPEEIGGALYCDGGISCNVPLAPLVREKCTDAIVVHLSQTGRISGDVPDSMHVLEIRPSVPLARRGVLDFSCGRIEKLIRLGYDDCKKALSGRLGRFLP